MGQFNRRQFLGSAAAAVAGASAAGSAHAAIPTTQSAERVVVIGSGFGGGVSALRLGQAGVKVLVLERGRWWPTGPNADTFPVASAIDKRVLFYNMWPELFGKRIGIHPYAGLLEPVAGQNLTAVTPACVGGGSLVYQGMSMQPTEALFAAAFPAGIDYKEMAAKFYPMVARMLQLETAPDELINSPTYLAARLFAQRAQAAGFDVEKIYMPIDWRYALAELRGEMKPSYTNGNGALGVNNGGKHSVDVTYLKQAMDTGNVTVAALHNVTRVARAANGLWTIHVDRTDEAGTVLEHKVISARTLIMSAGTINTVKLLVRAGARGDITGLPDGLGEGYGTNGDQIYIWSDKSLNMGPANGQGGPVIYGSREWANPQLANTVIQASLPPLTKSAASASTVLPSALVPGAVQVSATDAGTGHATMLVGYGVSAGRGRLVYNPLTDKVDLKWPKAGDAVIAKRIKERLSAIAGPTGKLINTNDIVNSTWHSLGGANIGVVCDLEGRVKGQKGLYVLDGALMPGTTCACNPSMTIAAVVERALDRIVRNDVGTII
ncbi:MAG: hypothetical protein RI920_2140 [Pseudomonadota bacterium]|jgi:cholesterol oxidase